jgi:hypothetical protein
MAAKASNDPAHQHSSIAQLPGARDPNGKTNAALAVPTPMAIAASPVPSMDAKMVYLS